ncbi:hypothetical protein UY3_01852 [Chelonia mydas]|uniref:Uncharacterized protein n=1 Tax=Chelonia mydas TaxID=8469 RepID=M7BSP7_CHEMY|nr:hypothetical protein UY3_01852 [Chelonia mydas]
MEPCTPFSPLQLADQCIGVGVDVTGSIAIGCSLLGLVRSVPPTQPYASVCLTILEVLCVTQSVNKTILCDVDGPNMGPSVILGELNGRIGHDGIGFVLVLGPHSLSEERSDNGCGSARNMPDAFQMQRKT